MNSYELKEFAVVMKDYNLSRVKMGEIELVMGESMASPAAYKLGPITHKDEQLTSLLKLNDKDLVDQLFPDHTQDAP